MKRSCYCSFASVDAFVVDLHSFLCFILMYLSLDLSYCYCEQVFSVFLCMLWLGLFALPDIVDIFRGPFASVFFCNFLSVEVKLIELVNYNNVERHAYVGAYFVRVWMCARLCMGFVQRAKQSKCWQTLAKVSE